VVLDGGATCVPDGKGEICDGLDNDCDPGTPDGAHEPTLGNACDGADGDLCEEGLVRCDAGEMSCDDLSADATEVCDGSDNDCDGSTDETCERASFPVLDFAVSGDGAAVAIGSVSNKVRMMCFGPDGSVVRDAFDAAGPEAPSHNAVSRSVARARDAGNVTITFTYRPTTLDWRNFIAFFDRDCQPVAGPFVLDADLANSGLNRRLSLAMTDDGRSYVLYEHDAEKKFRALVFDAAGTRTAAVTLTRPSECAGDGRPAMLALNAGSGDFGVFCETGTTRNFRRFSANGAPIDVATRPVPDSYPDSFSFYYWGAAMNRAGAFLYFGRNEATQWIIRPYAADGQLGAGSELQGTGGLGAPRAEVTSQGSFLVELAGEDYQLALIDTAGAVSRNWSATPGMYRLDAEDNVYVVQNEGIVRSQTVSLR
jgi:hypothetical protein